MINITSLPSVSVLSETNTKIECAIDIDGRMKNIYYIVESDFAKYLTTERVDPFLLGILQFAMKEGHDIKVEVPVSEKLYFNMVETIVPLLATAFGHYQIKIECTNLDSSFLTNDKDIPMAVGTGCSLGVDSLGSILYYTQADIPEHYRVNSLTYFNVGAMGDDPQKSTISYCDDLPKIEEYASFKRLPLVKISSNIGELYKNWNFNQCHHTRNAATVLVLQKYFRRYYYASGLDISHLGISDHDGIFFEIGLTPYLSTENTDFIVGQPTFTRIDKTMFISDFSETYSRLYVCWKEIIKNKYGIEYNEHVKLNCGKCEKCRRTMLALFLLEKESCYKDAFDWTYFYKNKDKFIGYALSQRKSNPFYDDLVKLMKRKNYRPSLKSRLYAFAYRVFFPNR